MFWLDKIIDKRIARYQSDLLATHYAEVENMYRQIRGWRHDYRNHIQVGCISRNSEDGAFTTEILLPQ